MSGCQSSCTITHHHASSLIPELTTTRHHSVVTHSSTHHRSSSLGHHSVITHSSTRSLGHHSVSPLQSLRWRKPDSWPRLRLPNPPLSSRPPMTALPPPLSPKRFGHYCLSQVSFFFLFSAPHSPPHPSRAFSRHSSSSVVHRPHRPSSAIYLPP
jgi:hypothetical protein